MSPGAEPLTFSKFNVPDTLNPLLGSDRWSSTCPEIYALLLSVPSVTSHELGPSLHCFGDVCMHLRMSSLGLVFGTVVYAYTYIYICLVYCNINKRILHSISVSYGFSRNILSSYSTLWYIVVSCSVLWCWVFPGTCKDGLAFEVWLFGSLAWGSQKPTALRAIPSD